MRTLRLTLVLCFLFLGLNCARAQEEADFSGSLLKRFHLSGYFQGGYAAIRNQDCKENSFYVRNAIVSADARITRRWSFLGEFNFAKGQFRDLYLDYMAVPWLHIRFGQMSKAFGMESDLAPDMSDVINLYSRSTGVIVGIVGDPIYDAYMGRDIGIKLWGDIPGIPAGYQIALMNGSGENTKDDNNQKDLMGKVTWRILSGLNLTGSFYLGSGHGHRGALIRTPKEFTYSRRRAALGIQYKAPRFRVHSEVLVGKSGEAKTTGAYATMAIPLHEGLEAVASIDRIHYALDENYYCTDYIAGLQYWFHNNCRAQLQYTLTDATGLSVSHMLQTQIQIGF